MDTRKHVEIGLIVACSENGVIGVDGDLPWRLPEDLKHFMRSTKGHAVIMGRKTFESLEKPLGGRLNVVVSSSLSLKERAEGEEWGVVVARSFDEAIAVARDADAAYGKGLIWIAGGGEIYRQSVGLADVVVRTRVHCEAEGDVTFDALGEEWGLERSEVHGADDRHSCGFTIEWWRRD
tara:strand:- start:362839 stop:363375 length:537 start_codon:yes stop_codon:yes gene_type:complete